MSSDDVGADHCRVTDPGATGGTTEELLEFHRHLFAYEEAARRLAPASRVLEVGCGGGYGAELLASRGFHVTAVDPSMQAISYCAARYGAVRFAAASGTSLPFRDGAFDAVISMQVIEHIADARHYLRELRRVVRPQGRAILTTPNRALRLFPLQRPWNPYHVREYSRRSLAAELSGIFSDDEIFGVFATDDLMRIERARVHRMRIGGALTTLGSLPPVRLLSQLARRRSASVTDPPTASAPPAPAPRPIGQRDFRLDSRTRDCLDLFVVATKGR